jgi:hypothetical protein
LVAKPALQFEHVEEVAIPDPVENLPTPQRVQEAEEFIPDTKEYVPALQRAHRDEDDKPVCPEYDPAGQGEHTAEVLLPDPVEYVPTPQGMQAWPEYDPSSVPYVPAEHRLHAAAPFWTLMPLMPISLMSRALPVKVTTKKYWPTASHRNEDSLNDVPLKALALAVKHLVLPAAL